MAVGRPLCFRRGLRGILNGVSDRIIGVDVGGTKIAAAALEGGELAETGVVRTETRATELFLDQLEEVVRTAGDASAVGIAVPSVVDWASGSARFSVNIPLAGVPLREVLGERLGVPIYVDNDATCAALAEAHSDPAGIPAVLVMLTLGTGVGGGIVLGGRSFRGATGAAAELGHIIVSADLTNGAPPASNRWPQPDSLEGNADGDALTALARDHGLPDGKAAVAAAQEGTEEACEILRVYGERVGVGIANLMNIFDPDEVVIGGGVSAAGELVRGPAEEAARRLALPGVGTRTRVRLARYGNDAGVRGAALMAAQELALHLEGSPDTA
jgi:glucokinase